MHSVGEEATAPQPLLAPRADSNECLPPRAEAALERPAVASSSSIGGSTALSAVAKAAPPASAKGFRDEQGTASTALPSDADDASVADRSSLASGCEVGAVHSVTSCSVDAQDSASQDGGARAAQAQHLVKSFVRAHVKGRAVSVLAMNGGLAECLLFLDRKLSALTLARGVNNDNAPHAPNALRVAVSFDGTRGWKRQPGRRREDPRVWLAGLQEAHGSSRGHPGGPRGRGRQRRGGSASGRAVCDAPLE